MKVVVVRRENRESNERCITRWNKRVQASRKLLTARKRYHVKPLTKTQVRKAAVKRDEYRAINNKRRFYV